MVALTVNGKNVAVKADADMPLLWVVRDKLGLKGTKYSCGSGACGACLVHLDGRAVPSCTTPVSEVGGREVTTIEGVARDCDSSLFRAWIAEQASQCGYCQPGMIMAAAALIAQNPSPTDADIDAAMSGVLCRCGTYQRVRRAIHRAANDMKGTSEQHGESSLEPEEMPEVVFAPDQWIRIHSDGSVTLVIDKAEMGQGAITGLAMLVAEELEVELSRIRTVFAPADPAYFNHFFEEQITGGSTSIRSLWEPLRRAAATAREMLVAAAAETWGVETATCRAENNTVVQVPSGRRLDYGVLARKATALPVPETVTLKDPATFRLIGTSAPRLHIPAHLDGSTLFGIDTAVRGMLVAAVARCPVFGGKAARFDGSRAKSLQGVHDVVEIETGIAVVADSFWSALKGREALDVVWDEGAHAGLTSADISCRFEQAAQHAGRIARNEGDVDAAFKAAPKIIEAVYQTPYLAHAVMEPMNCIARVEGGGCDIWVPSQAQTLAQETAAAAADLAPDKVRVHSTFLGGGFGRRLKQDFVAEAVQIAKAVGATVQLIWTREDCMRHDFYRPANYTLLRAAFDARGMPLAWSQRIVGPSLSFDGVDLPYDIPNIREEHIKLDPGVPTGPWRSVGSSQNAFVIESFIDEMAAVAGADPLAFRLKLLAHAPRHRAVLAVAAEKAGWGNAAPQGRYRGIATYFSYGSWVAQVAEASVLPDYKVKVHRVVAAIDCGIAVNPDCIAAQIEGAVVFGLTAAVKAGICIADGRVVESNFHDYPLVTMAEAPEVEVHIVPGQEPLGGVGEPGVPPIAPAVANAVFAATGKRVRQLPIRAADLEVSN